jgi:hypothetical protein
MSLALKIILIATALTGARPFDAFVEIWGVKYDKAVVSLSPLRSRIREQR